MTISLILFFASGLGIIILIGLKILQEKMGMLLFWPSVREKGEVFLQQQTQKVHWYTRAFSKQSLYIALHYILSRLRTLVMYVQQKIDKRLVHLVNLIKGRQMLDATRGRASHFLHDISRFKDKFRRD
jgi:hypothetical protein